jgi:hypothetical protein
MAWKVQRRISTVYRRESSCRIRVLWRSFVLVVYTTCIRACRCSPMLASLKWPNGLAASKNISLVCATHSVWTPG